MVLLLFCMNLFFYLFKIVTFLDAFVNFAFFKKKKKHHINDNTNSKIYIDKYGVCKCKYYYQK